MRKIPTTMATQHPDNAAAPYWLKTPFVSTGDEVDECYRAFSDLGCNEYMWDWEGKFVDEAVIDRLFNSYAGYFKKHPLGREKFLTFRVPNTWKESGYRLARAFMTILTAAHTAKEFGAHTPPIFEVILPMTTHAQQLLILHEKFALAIAQEKELFGKKLTQSEDLEVIPLIEGSATLVQSRQILKDYVAGYQKMFQKRPKYLRPFIARSDPALDAGFVPAVISARGALSEYYRFQEETGIRVFPIIGVGSLPFRGNLAPETLHNFLKNYGGVRTVTIQSGFRYDYPLTEVKRAIASLHKILPVQKATRFSEDEIKKIMRFSELFAHQYRPVVSHLAKIVNELAQFVPSQRERIPHTGHFGYSRDIGPQKVKLPRAITFAAVFYSLGIPPSLIGTGRGLQAVLKSGEEKFLHRILPTFREDLIQMGHHLNWENLRFLARKNPVWEEVRKDVQILEDFLGRRLGPKEPDDFIHRNVASNIYHLWNSWGTGHKDKAESLQQEIVQAALVRRSLG